eukprot:CAMPEP_0194038392 /NCGR_PEP_ID=MMETSP0009_2-20130614/10632_1 /TAXON_ID=210454 /ORGANISM="Grammatophora oceanica, Strain CCMP 410" /LENGTH=271 /DNA_ID=CAMNT_0038680875 /DNA_START=9 /DNA_END=824 /DNA_ORIENTATION=+
MVEDDYISRLPLVDEDCRQQMIEWFCKIVDYCQFERETVEIAVNYLDRYLSNKRVSSEESITRDRFHLVAMTSLYLAAKIHEPIAMEAPIVASLSGGQVTVEQLLDCEQELLGGLNWRMHPPTSMSFARHFVGRFKVLQREQLLELSKIQLEAAVQDYSIVQHNVLPSMLAAAAVSNSLLCLGAYDDAASELSFAPLVAARLSEALPTTSDEDSFLSLSLLRREEKESESTTTIRRAITDGFKENHGSSSPTSVTSSSWSLMTRLIEQITA